MHQNRFGGLRRETMTDALIASTPPLHPVINTISAGVNKGEVLKSPCVCQSGCGCGEGLIVADKP